MEVHVVLYRTSQYFDFFNCDDFSENHIIVGELLELKSLQQVDLNTPKVAAADINWNPDSDASHDTGGYTLGFSLTVLQVVSSLSVCHFLFNTTIFS